MKLSFAPRAFTPRTLTPRVLTQSTLAFAVMGLSAFTPSAQADVSWHHRISVRMGGPKKPLFSMAMFNDWSGRKHRTMFSVSPNALSGSSMNLPGKMPTTQALALSGAGVYKLPNVANSSAPIQVATIYDLEADRYISYSSPTRTYSSEAFSPLMKRLRFDPWKKVAPELSQGETPSLTTEQRARLGAEVRATYSGWLKKVLKGYFRALPETRTINGLQSRGYRMTWLVNAGGTKSPQWARVKYEWWIADEQSGDEEVRGFQRETRDLVKSVGWPSSSMWINEMYPVLWQMLPVELHRAAATFLPPEGSPREMFGGTPVMLHMTVQPPALQRASMGGDIRADVELISRNTNPLPARVFAAPASYKKMNLEPFLKQYDTLMAKYSEFLSGKVPNMDNFPDMSALPFPGMKMPGL